MNYRAITLPLLILFGIGIISEPPVWALEMHPPWIHDTPKAKSPTSPPWIGHTKVKEKSPYHPPWVGHSCDSVKSPYFPPWIGTKCHQIEAPAEGVWGYTQDWRDVDWSQAKYSGVYQRTQAMSLWIDKKIHGDERPQRDLILEYLWFPPLTGPGRAKD